MAEVEKEFGKDTTVPVETEVTVENDVFVENLDDSEVKEPTVKLNFTIEEPEKSVPQFQEDLKAKLERRHIQFEPQVSLKRRSRNAEVTVNLTHACKSYGGGVNILNNLNMTVPKGTIYGLLGSSGCGKTTLLRCIVGLLDLNHGEVTVFGGKPGTEGSGVPGPRIGYMPQEVALVGEFDVKGVIYYFGWLFGMNNAQIKDRYFFLSQLLQLPPGGQLVKDLSGGQQRRVSFAAALVQSPDLLILDEPTVGLDPVLRQRIWDYLVDISREQKTTIIITTHYIEEAKQAHMIGLLRGGTLLAEASPTALLREYNTLSLEEVFLTLSQKQTLGVVGCKPNTVQDGQVVLPEEMVEQDFSVRKPSLAESIHLPEPETPILRKSLTLTMKALLYKNFTRILNTYGGLFFVFIFPILEFIIFFTAVGMEAKGLKIGIVNDELGDCNALVGDPSQYSSAIYVENDTWSRCDLTGLSCQLVDALDDGTVTDHIFYKDLETALTATRRGHTSGTVHIPSNFSYSLQQRIMDGQSASNETLDNSEVQVYLDMSDFTGLAIQKHYYSSYEAFTDVMAGDCKLPKKLAHIPFLFNEPIFGSTDPVYTYFLAPGIMVSMLFFVCTTLTISIVSVDRTEKSWDRNLVAGVTSTEIVLSHLIAQSVCLIVQMVELLTLGFFIFNMKCNGNIADMLLLLALEGLSGVGFGMLISVVSKNLTTAAYIGMGSFYPFILSSGMLWPIEGMPSYLRYISMCLPNTWATTSLRNILDRGWGTLHPQVYPGMLVPAAWILGQSLLCMLVLRHNK